MRNCRHLSSWRRHAIAARSSRRAEDRSRGSCRGCCSTCRTAANSPPASRPSIRDREQILETYKQIGTVIEAFRLNHPAKYESIMAEYAGRAAIGHVRYATCGANNRSYAQPFERHHGCKWKWFSLAFNGQLANFAELEVRTARAGRLPPDARNRHRSHHALHLATSCAATTGPTSSRSSAT